MGWWITEEFLLNLDVQMSSIINLILMVKTNNKKLLKNLYLKKPKYYVNYI